MRTATVKIGDVEAVFDGETFTSTDMDVAAILNSALQVYRAVGSSIFKEGPLYWPDPLVNLAEAVAKYNGGELIAFDPPEHQDLPEGAVY